MPVIDIKTQKIMLPSTQNQSGKEKHSSLLESEGKSVFKRMASNINSLHRWEGIALKKVKEAFALIANYVPGECTDSRAAESQDLGCQGGN